MRKVFVSGCFDVLHGGYLEFFRQAKALGDYLIVCLPSDPVLFLHKKRQPWVPLEHKIHVIGALEPDHEVIVGDDLEPGTNFRSRFVEIRPQVLAVTEGGRFESPKRELCSMVGADYICLPKSLGYEKISTSEVRQRAAAMTQAPMRVDLAGGIGLTCRASPGRMVTSSTAPSPRS